VKSPAVLSVALRKPAQKSLVRYQTTWALDKEAEADLAKQKLVANPELVSIESSAQNIISEGQSEPEKDVDMMAGIRSDFVRWLRVPTFSQLMVVVQTTIKETFSLRDVPREALYVGLAGVVPYLATSLTTVYLALDIQYAALHGEGFILSGDTAEKLLHVIEPIQLGYGATVRSS
jgi:hypothetical protein